ncbi:MAG: 6,7-dimethyl-8-ribityllumazine synthase [Gemmatimonadales bacterium]
MTEFRGRLAAVGRIGIVVSAYHERITGALLEGALACCREAGVASDDIDVVWVAGAFELGSVAAAMARQRDYAALVALGVVIRGETPHFDYVAGETTRMLGRIATELGLPVGFGLLTVDTLAQATDRAGGAAGNKGREAAEAAIRAADVIQRLGKP